MLVVVDDDDHDDDYDHTNNTFITGKVIRHKNKNIKPICMIGSSVPNRQSTRKVPVSVKGNTLQAYSLEDVK
jgi:hypothetical protein